MASSRSGWLGAAIRFTTSAMITIDDATRPIFVVRMEGTLTDEGLVAHHAALDRAIAEHAAPFCLIFDVLTPGMTGAQRDLQIAWIKRFQAKHAAQNRGVAFVLASRVARGVVRGLHWAASPSYAYEVTGELTRAQAWCTKQLGR